MNKDKIYIYGKHALKEALISAPQSITKIFLAKRDDPEIESLIKKEGVPVGELSAASVENDASHQGVIASISPEKLVRSYDDFFKDHTISHKSFFVFLNGLSDPQNVGAIIRSAAAFGASGVIMPRSEQAPITGAVTKTSAGMVFRTPIISIGDKVAAIKDLKEKGFTVYGMESESKNMIQDEKFEGPTVFVMGNESKGLESEVLDLCDRLVAIPMDPKCESLNVSVAAGIALYAKSIKSIKI
jgi:23S rRNA (guanosine2251-2'-O)-methyltransferase